MDNKPVEYKAKLLIAQKLLKLNLLVTDPMFDISGSDLLILKEINKRVRLGIIQSKGRVIKRTHGSNIKIQKEYVKKNFVVFLYIEKKEINTEYLYCFFSDEIEKWPTDGKYFKLSIPVDFNNKTYFINSIYDTNRGNKIKHLLDEEDFSVKQIIKKYTIIDLTYSQWLAFNIIPSIEILNRILQQTDFSKTSIEQNLLIYISICLRGEEYENGVSEFTGIVPYEYLLNSFINYQNIDKMIINNKNLVTVKSITSGIHKDYDRFKKHIVSEIELLVGDKITTGIYCFVGLNKGAGIEIYLSKDDEIGFLIRSLTSNAETEEENTIQQLIKNYYS